MEDRLITMPVSLSKLSIYLLKILMGILPWFLKIVIAQSY